MSGTAEPSRGSGLPSWLDGTLYARRIVLLTGWLDDAGAARTAATLVSLDAASAAPIELQVHGVDGTLEAAFVLVDTLETLRAPVRARCRGRIGTAAVGVVAAAGHRAASPHARFRLAQPDLRLSGTPDQVEAGRRWHRDRLARFQAHLARATGRPFDDIAHDMRRGRELDAREALACGLIDAIDAGAQ